MSEATKCEACGRLVEVAMAIRIDSLETPAAGPDLVDTWDNIDICAACLDRPMRDVLSEACIDVVLPLASRRCGAADCRNQSFDLGLCRYHWAKQHQPLNTGDGFVRVPCEGRCGRWSMWGSTRCRYCASGVVQP